MKADDGRLDAAVVCCNHAPMDWTKRLAGKFIVFDGPDGSGKSTQFKRFAAWCRERGTAVCEVREPGGTAIGEQIRKILLDPVNTEMSLRAEMMLYMASRAQLVEQIVRPAIGRGELVLADRFVSSTLAYQGTAGGLPLPEIMKVGEIAIGGNWPNLVVIFDVDEHTAAKRTTGRARGAKDKRAESDTSHVSLFSDRLEARGLEYQRRVRQGFLAQAQSQPDQYLVIDATNGPDSVFDSLIAKLKARI